ncbi:C6 zinc finger domain-containing protein [Colletotrichum truncatum]|uniref:C6 zinc finger domain-containing protein n=1 Tax=Colletotrichum truncatum TaxID=5467 RepID=A0ACC3Z2T4_COLTU|nr:C6 zinc finger domain-containing protein [Colletotrichum truncatum]KAF6793310.1 C6 zinc finger domain-containing protein [Colletotrichum truncatum]
MASLARPIRSRSRFEEKRVKRDGPKQRRRPPSPPRQRKAPGYPVSWVSRWKHRPQHTVPCSTPPQEEQSTALTRRSTPPNTPDEKIEPELILPQTIVIGPEIYTLNRFYMNYATNASIVFFNNLPVHYQKDLSDANHTRHATHAVALASASRQLCQPGLMLKARQHYGKAIATLSQALKDPVRVRDDSNMVTLFLFGMFEVVVGQRSPKAIDLEQNVFPHGDGGLQLLRFRVEQGIANDVDKGTFMFFCHAALMEMFIQREHLTGIWSALENVDTPWGKGPILEPLIRQVVDYKKAVDFKVQVQADISKITSDAAEDLLKLLQSGVSVCNDLQAAATLLDFSGASSFAGQQQKVFNGLFSLSTDTSVALARSHYRCLRIFVLEKIIELRGILKETSTKIGPEMGQIPTWSDGVSVVEEVLDDICTVFGLEGKEAPKDGLPYRTMTMFWPMVMVRTSCFAGPHNGRWVAEKMLKLTSESGFGLGVEAASL